MNNATSYAEEALKSGRAIFHTMGNHAGESPDAFVARKQLDIAQVGYTFWYARSLQPPNALNFCQTPGATFVSVRF